MIRQAERYKKKRVVVDGARMGYVDAGQGDPIVLLHGNGTSSYLWRNVMPFLEGLGRCIAPDLAGMGTLDDIASEGYKRCGFAEQRGFLENFLEALDVQENVTLVMHGWGSTLGFDWANHHREAVKGIVYMEAPVMAPQMAGRAGQICDVMGSPGSGADEAVGADDCHPVEQLLSRTVLRALSEAEIAVYRRADGQAGDSWQPAFDATGTADGAPEDVCDIITDYMRWLPRSPVPKLFINGEPGMIAAIGDNRALCRSFANQSEVSVPGLHYLQEDSPEEIGQAIANWLRIMG